MAIRLYLSLSVNSTSHLSNFADFRQLQIPNARTKYHEILLLHTKTPHHTTPNLQIDILNLNTTFRHCKKSPITFEQWCTHMAEILLPYFSGILQSLYSPLQNKKSVLTATKIPQTAFDHNIQIESLKMSPTLESLEYTTTETSQKDLSGSPFSNRDRHRLSHG